MNAPSMSRGLSIALGLVGLWLAAGIGATLSLRTTGSVFAPNLPLVLIGTLGLHLSRRRGIALGFLAGFFEGALAGANMLPYIFTRTLAGLAAASLGAQTGERNAPIAAVATAALSLAANLLFVFLTAPRGFGFFLLAAVVGALVNAVLALPVGLLFSRLAGGRDRSGF